MPRIPRKDSSSDNGGVQASQHTPAKALRKSIISKGLKRTINTAQFESLVIEHSIEETIEWSSLDERMTKERNWERILTDEFKKMHDRILTELGLVHKVAYFKSTTAETAERYKHANPAVRRNENKPLVDVDALDDIG